MFVAPQTGAGLCELESQEEEGERTGIRRNVAAIHASRRNWSSS